MTRPSSINKRPRLGPSPTTLSSTLPIASVSVSSQSSTASSTTVTGVATVGGASTTGITGAPPGTTSSSTRPSPPHHSQHHLPVQHHYHTGPPPPARGLRHTPPSLSLPSSSTAAHHSGSIVELSVSTSHQHPLSQHSGSGSIPVPSPTSTNSSAPFQYNDLDRYQNHRQQSNTNQYSTPSSATHASFVTHSPSTVLPSLTSPTTVPPGHSISAPPVVSHPPPPGDPASNHYRGHYPGQNPNPTPATPTSSSFADRQQSAPAGAPHPTGPMVMDHSAGGPSPHHHSGYGPPPPRTMDAPMNGNSQALAGPNGSHYQPVQQPTEQYAPPHTPHHPPPGYHQQPAMVTGYPYPPPTNQNWQTPQHQGGAKQTVKKNSRAHVACNNCRTRKQKCDEENPCGYCKQENIPCNYREVAAPKQDKNLAGLQDSVKNFEERLKTWEETQKTTQSQNDHTNRMVAQILERMNGGSGEFLAAGTRSDQLPPPSTQRVHSENTEEDTAVTEQAPGAHSTGAQHLSKKFPLTKAWFKAAGVENYETYPYEKEQRRGTLRIYGSGWSGDDTAGLGPDANLLYNASFADSQPPRFNKGGLNPNGTLRLDQATVKRLHDNYMQKMWIIYPIFNAEELKARIVTFCATYSPLDEPKPETPPNMHYAAHSPHGSNSLKRSFSEMEGPIPEDKGFSAGPKRPIDYSLNNAIILLVLALGKLCEHEDYIMADEIEKPNPFSEESMSQGSSPNFRPSSTRSTNSSASPKFPNNIMNSNPYHEHIPANAKNVFKIPGLAYYAEAASMLGHCVGRRDIESVQAYILAGLYWGQVGHTLTSSNWVHSAAITAVELLQTFPLEDITISPNATTQAGKDAWWNAIRERRSDKERDDIGLFLIAFWTVHQMEGDIAAEWERLPTSSIGSHTQIGRWDVAMPQGLVGVYGDSLPLFTGFIDTRNQLNHFCSQLKLRLYLNRAHLALYGTDEQKQASINERRLTWADLRPDDLWESVKAWRLTLPPGLFWVDGDEPPSDILQARLRAKYYGFVYIIGRKVLEGVAASSGPLDIDVEALRYATLGELEGTMQEVGVGCKRCILAAMDSTIAFDNTCDGTRKRAILPNIMGTFTAQFSNMLILSYCYLDSRLRPLVDPEKLITLLQRTIRLLHNLTPMSPVFKTNKTVLLQAYEAVATEMNRNGIKRVELPIIDQRNHTLLSNNNWPTPPGPYGSPGVQSAGRQSQGPGTPRDHYVTSAATSFSAPR